jgi:hypothetical protein
MVVWSRDFRAGSPEKLGRMMCKFLVDKFLWMGVDSSMKETSMTKRQGEVQ